MVVRPRSWLADLAHPVPLGAAALLLLNDHVFKPAAWPSAAVAGKLSDVAGLFLFPLVLAALARALARALGRPGAGWTRPEGAAAITAVLFTGLKTWPGLNHAAAALVGPIALDPGDLLALPAIAGSLWWMRRGRPAGRAQASWAAAGALALAALACAATEPPRYARQYPLWQLEPPAALPVALACARGRAWVVKSGKSGVGLTVELMGAATGPCRVVLRGARLELTGGRAIRSAAPQPPAAAWTLAPCQVQRFYLPFLFDNNAAWNHGARSGRFLLDLVVGRVPAPDAGMPAGPARGALHSWRMAASESLGALHRRSPNVNADVQEASSRMNPPGWACPVAPPMEKAR